MSDPQAKRRSWSQICGIVLGSSMVAAAAVGPALAEAQVHAQLRERFDDPFAIDLDLAGLELRGLSRALPDGRGRVRIDRVRVRPSFDGLDVEIVGLDATLLREAEPRRAAAPKSKHPPSARGSSPAPAGSELERLLQRLRGVPIDIEVDGTVTIELGEGLSAVATDPRIELAGDGRIAAAAAVELTNPLPNEAGRGPVWARAKLKLHTSDDNLRDIRADGALALDREAGASLRVSAHATPQTIAVDLHEPAGGQARLTIQREAEDGRKHARLDAEDLPLALLEPLAQLLGRRLGDAIGEREGELRLDDARITGAIELVRGGYLTRARFDDLVVSRLRIDSPLIAAEPVELDSLTIDGELAREHTERGPRSFGELVLAHRGVQLELSGQLDPAGLSFDMQLPTTSCQALLDATPGLSPTLAGSVLHGQLDARFGLDLDFAALEQARARYLADGATLPELEDFEAPGELRFWLPFLEQCSVERLGPGVDIDGLRGAYHHRFASSSGASSQRVLALGDAEFVPIGHVPELALAFVILEDARFWQHDGFDREQIERAFWFNLLDGKVSRGASTISQQTARSLWLGIDRSITRKLAEALLAAELERGVDKRRILEIYLNVIELGPEVHGVVEAAGYHFGKHPSQLSLLEALHLASMAPAPVAYSRRFASGHVDRQWRDHLHRQIRRLQIRRLISPAQAEAALRGKLHVKAHPELLSSR